MTYSTPVTPVELDPSLIGRVVVVQVFDKSGGEIIPKSLQKCVGTLQYYMKSEKQLILSMDGVPLGMVIDLVKRHVEVYVPMFGKKSS